jgi:deoxyribodipyrimidine photo-lyase
MTVPFPATRAEALARLAAFAPRAGRAYGGNRNRDAGPGRHIHVSRLSPALRRRVITEAEVLAAVLEQHSPSAADSFIREVCWRTYWKGWLEQRPAVWRAYLTDVAQLEQDADLMDRVSVATSGQTGIDCFDAWATELATTGYLHNHARMWAASIWVFTLRLPWQLGARWFLHHLLDGDPASNTLSWRWVAGLHTAGKHYLARASNIRDYTDGRFDPRGCLEEAAVPLPPDGPFPRQPLPKPAQPDPALRTGLFLTTEDLDAPSLLAEYPTLEIVALAAPDRIGGTPSLIKRTFVESALSDGVARAESHSGVAADRLDEAALVSEMRAWASGHGLTQVVTAYPAVGPVADRVGEIGHALAQDGVTLVRLSRAWDVLAWPHATKGFFAFKEVIPTLLETLPVRQGALL